MVLVSNAYDHYSVGGVAVDTRGVDQHGYPNLWADSPSLLSAWSREQEIKGASSSCQFVRLLDVESETTESCQRFSLPLIVDFSRMDCDTSLDCATSTSNI